MNSLYKKVLGEILFWIHIKIILLGLLLGIIFPLTTVIIVFAAHRLHLTLFRGCAVTKLQKAIGAIPKDMGFTDFAIQRLFHKHLNARQLKTLDYGMIGVSVGITLLYRL